jgi:sulfoxide reductase catalytic subunit YedY
MRIRLSTLLWLASPLVLPVVLAYLQWATVGLPTVSFVVPASLDTLPSQGFPPWLRVTHFINFLFIILLIRSGLQILMDHPRLYWNVHCTPRTEWLRVTPLEVPQDKVWTAKEDSRYLSPWIGLPGYRHTVGMARHWHFLSVLFWVANGFVYVAILFGTGQWRRFVPTSWHVVPDAWAYFVHYVTFHIPQEPDTFSHYNPLQQLSYFGVVFVLAPLAMLTGPSMSPAFTNRFKWYPKLPGNRQIGRSIHFLIMIVFVLFIFVHVAMVSLTGFVRNMNHIVVGTNDTQLVGVYLGFVGIGVVVAVNALANWLAWRHPRLVQHFAKIIVTPVMRFVLDRPEPQAEFLRENISPFFWANGKLPICEAWKTLAANDFRDYRLKVSGLVKNPVELSLDDLRAMGKKEQITLHHCIQGWSGIAEWGGLPLLEIVKLVRPKPEVQAVVFYSFGEGGEGGQFYDSLSMQDAIRQQTILAYEMDFEPLNHLHGAPLRLRVENQLGFKMVKWIQAIEFVESVKAINKGEGGYNEDHEYYGELANI